MPTPAADSQHDTENCPGGADCPHSCPSQPKLSRGERRVLVCDKCLRACCWYGEFMCDDAQGAGTGILTTRQLRRLNLEHPDYWSRKKFAEVYGEPNITFSPGEPDLSASYLRRLAEEA